MIHGGIGHIEKGRISIPEDLLKPISIRNGTIVFGIYYPPRFEDESYANVETKVDFMLSPIPFRLWPKVGSLSVRLKHQPGAIEKICDCLLKKNTSILQAEVTRSAHRYAVWNITVAFDSIEGDKLTFDQRKSVYIETEKALKQIKEATMCECEDLLFKLREDAYFKGPIIERVHPGLAFFYSETIKRTKDWKDSWIYEPFQLKCEDENMLVSTDQKEFNTILDHLDKVEGKIIPTFFIASMDTNYINLRLALIPPEKQHTFFKLHVNYTRSGYPDSSRGLLHHIVTHFPPKYNIWRLWNHTGLSMPTREEGSIEFIIEDQADKVVTSKICIRKAMDILSAFRDKPKPKEIEHISELDFKVHPIEEFDVYYDFKKRGDRKRKYEYDVFISYSKDDIEIASRIKEQLELSGLKPFMAKKDIKGGENFHEKIRKALINSMEICLIFTKNSKESDWVKVEAGAAWILNKKIVPILYGTFPEDLPEILKVYQAYEYHNLDLRDYTKSVKEKKSQESED